MSLSWTLQLSRPTLFKVDRVQSTTPHPPSILAERMIIDYFQFPLEIQRSSTVLRWVLPPKTGKLKFPLYFPNFSFLFYLAVKGRGVGLIQVLFLTTETIGIKSPWMIITSQRLSIQDWKVSMKQFGSSGPMVGWKND